MIQGDKKANGYSKALCKITGSENIGSRITKLTEFSKKTSDEELKTKADLAITLLGEFHENRVPTKDEIDIVLSNLARQIS